MSYQLLLTTLGSQKIVAAAVVGAEPLSIVEFAVGQGVNVDFSQRLDEQVLVSKRYRTTVASVAPVSGQKNQYEVTCIVPQSEGGWTIRELGLFDSDGDLIWVGQLPEVQKPVASSTAAVDYRIKAVISIDNPNVSLLIDANVVTATRGWVTDNFIPRSALELLYPYGYKYWSHLNQSPKAGFDALFGYDTFWRKLEGVHLVAVDTNQSAISEPMLYAGIDGDVTSPDNRDRPDHYEGYTSYLWERYDPENEPFRYDGRTKLDGSKQFL